MSTSPKNLKKTKYDNLTVIKTPFIQHLLLPIFFAIVITWVFVSGQSSYYAFPLMILLIFLIYKIWILFESINVIKIYKEESFFIVTPRNIIKRIVVRGIKIYFQEIKKFEVKAGPEIMLENERSIIYAVLNDSTNILLHQQLRKLLSMKLCLFSTR